MTGSSDRLASLDVFRGAAVAGMILVNNPGNWSTTFEPLTHADWNGCTFADVVFPCFIFIMGVAMPFTFARSVVDGQSARERYTRVLRRSSWLLLLGLMLNVVAAAPHVIDTRVPGVLQRLGLVYLIAAPLVITLNAGWRTVVIGALVVGHWALLVIPMSGSEALARTHNVSGLIDQAVLGRHLLTATGDPEGLLGTIPAVATALMGSVAGSWIGSPRPVAVRVTWLIGGGLAALCLGLLWATVLPLNKSLWTGSFTLFTGGVAALAFTIGYLLCDVFQSHRWLLPFSWLGLNPLAIYFSAELCGHLIDTPWQQGAGQMTVRAWMFWDVLNRMAPNVPDAWLSLAFALATVAWWTSVAGVLYYRGIRIRA